MRRRCRLLRTRNCLLLLSPAFLLLLFVVFPVLIFILYLLAWDAKWLRLFATLRQRGPLALPCKLLLLLLLLLPQLAHADKVLRRGDAQLVGARRASRRPRTVHKQRAWSNHRAHRHDCHGCGTRQPNGKPPLLPLQPPLLPATTTGAAPASRRPAVASRFTSPLQA
jgi:hypothetical protein